MVTKSDDEKFILSHVRWSALKQFSEDIRISPIRKEPKNARQQAVQKILLLSWDHELIAISWPKIFSSGRVIISLVLLDKLEYNARLPAPLIIDFTKKSSKMSVL